MLGHGLPGPSSHFSVLWRLHRSWALAIPSDFQTPLPHDIVLGVAVTSLLLGWLLLSILTLFSVHCLFRPWRPVA